MSETQVTYIDLQRLFESPHLHLLVWNRFDDGVHESALVFIKQLIEDAPFSGSVMPMLRPLGRKEQDYNKYQCVGSYGSIGSPNIDYVLLDGVHTSHCEAWIQVPQDLESLVWDEITSWRDCYNNGFAKRSIDNPVWQPLSAGTTLDQCEYGSSRNGKGVSFLCSLPEHQAPWFLKLVWFRASEVICRQAVQESGFRRFDPVREGVLVVELIQEMLDNIPISDYGLSSTYESIDPTIFGVSHMSVFAINAVTKVSQEFIYQVEQYTGNHTLSRPALYPSRDEYLTQLRLAMTHRNPGRS